MPTPSDEFENQEAPTGKFPVNGSDEAQGIHHLRTDVRTLTREVRALGEKQSDFQEQLAGIMHRELSANHHNSGRQGALAGGGVVAVIMFVLEIIDKLGVMIK